MGWITVLQWTSGTDRLLPTKGLKPCGHTQRSCSRHGRSISLKTWWMMESLSREVIFIKNSFGFHLLDTFKQNLTKSFMNGTVITFDVAAITQFQVQFTLLFFISSRVPKIYAQNGLKTKQLAKQPLTLKSKIYYVCSQKVMFAIQVSKKRKEHWKSATIKETKVTTYKFGVVNYEQIDGLKDRCYPWRFFPK